MNKEIIRLDPVFTHNIWGGTKLKTDFAYNVEGNDIGECWGISAHPNGDCLVKNGEFKGKKLSWLWENHPELFGNVKINKFPLLVKIIDAKDDLSIQVHPNDDYAKVNENGSLGKTESWYIIDCDDNASLVVGHKAKDKKELAEMIHQGKWYELIREVPVKKGDFIQIDSGTMHAIKGGILILETQQSSDITYRVYDYDRLSNGKPRQLHIEKSIDVMTVPAKPVDDCVKSTNNLPSNRLNKLHECDYYKIFLLIVNHKMSFEQCYPFLLISVIEGNGLLNGENIKKGDHLIIPAGFENVSVEGIFRAICSTI